MAALSTISHTMTTLGIFLLLLLLLDELSAVSGQQDGDNATAVTETPAEERGSVGLAFAFTIGAGLCTTIGGALSFLGRVEDKRVLTICLALSAGVMIYVSFVEIFAKSSGAMAEHFVEQGKTDVDAGDLATLSTTGLFFAGVLLTWLLEKGLQGCGTGRSDSTIDDADVDDAVATVGTVGDPMHEKAKLKDKSSGDPTHICPCHGPDSTVVSLSQFLNGMVCERPTVSFAARVSDTCRHSMTSALC
eukprot:SAG31_NODE_147_length_22539_cov_37.073663_21_plen_247_part_00